MIIAEGMDEIELNEKVDRIKVLASEIKNLYFAVGSYVACNDEDIRKAMRSADERMYDDKKNFYSLHPELKYR